MSKELVIKSDNCVISKGAYVKINGEEIEDLIKYNLPDMEEYKEYRAEVLIQIRIHENEPLAIGKIGYEDTEEYSTDSLEEALSEEETDNAI